VRRNAIWNCKKEGLLLKLLELREGADYFSYKVCQTNLKTLNARLRGQDAIAVKAYAALPGTHGFAFPVSDWWYAQTQSSVCRHHKFPPAGFPPR
jgi:hypothetical protein